MGVDKRPSVCIELQWTSSTVLPILAHNCKSDIHSLTRVPTSGKELLTRLAGQSDCPKYEATLPNLVNFQWH